ncbi:MAG: ABC transporter ATP-binding protein [Candidatus Zixiibacteriota bacterium]
MISVKNLRKQYGQLVAVNAVSFDVSKGCIFGLLGPNGAGKSTTINMLAGLLTPDSGSVHIDTEGDPANPEVRRKIGNAPQSIALYEALTGEENLRFFGRLYHLHGRQLAERVAWVLDLVGLTERKSDRVETYSGGMMRRLNLACALVHDPPILLLDEPTVGVDPQSRNLIFVKIEQLKAEGRTIVYTTHYMEEAERLCDVVAIIDQGRILDLDTVERLIQRHGGNAMVEAELLPHSAKPNIPGAVINDTSLRFASVTPLEDIARLSEQGILFRTLRIERADLESVFLNLTGRRLRD